MKKARPHSSASIGGSTPPRRRRGLQLALGFIGAVLIVEALVGDNGLLAMRRARQEYQMLERSLARARAENERLRDVAARLREDPATIEDLARRELGLIKPGEKLFILKDVRPAGRSSGQ